MTGPLGCNHWCKWKWRKHNIHIFGFGVCVIRNFFVHRTSVLGSTFGESFICWISLWGLETELVLWPVCDSFLSMQTPLLITVMVSVASEAHTVPHTWLLWAGAHNCLLWWAWVLSLYLGFREVPEGNSEKESHWLHLSPPSNFSETNVASTKSCIVVRWKNCLENQFWGFRGDSVSYGWFVTELSLPFPIAAKTPPITFPWLW